MQPKFHYFALSRKNNLFSLTDPIVLEGGHRITNLLSYDYETSQYRDKLFQDNLQEHIMKRGIFTAYASDVQVQEFLSQGILLKPHITPKNNIAIYYLKDLNLILLKGPGADLSFTQTFNLFYPLLQTFLTKSKEQLLHKLEELQKSQDEECSHSIVLETQNATLCLAETFAPMISIKSETISEILKLMTTNK